MVYLFALAVLFGDLATNVSGFAPTRLNAQLTNAPTTKGFSLQNIHLHQSNDDDEEPELLKNLMPKDNDDWRADFSNKMKFTEEEMEELRAQIKEEIVDASIEADLKAIDKLKQTLAEEAVASKKRMSEASQLNAQYTKQNLLEKIDAMTDEFLNSNKDFRDATKRIAAADQMAATSGRGVDWGSWGTVGGLDVVVGESSDMGRLLGSVDSARRRGEVMSSDADGKPIVSENRIMVVSDEQKVS